MGDWLDEGRVALLSGGVAGLTTSLVLHPLDVVKTRLQGTLAPRDTSWCCR
jgi:hypothetical protein